MRKGHDPLKKKEEKLHQLESSLWDEVQPSFCRGLPPLFLGFGWVLWSCVGTAGLLGPRIGSRLRASGLVKTAVASALNLCSTNLGLWISVLSGPEQTRSLLLKVLGRGLAPALVPEEKFAPGVRNRGS